MADRRIPYPLRGDWAITANGRDLVLDVWQTAHSTGRADRLLAALESREGEPFDNKRDLTIQNKVALVPVEGPIFRKAERLADVSGATSFQWVERQLLAMRAAYDAGEISGGVMVFNSPGGEAAGMIAAGEKVREIADYMPLWAYVETQASSAAWGLASQCGKIVAHRSAYVGSIGVRRMVTDTAKAEQKMGVVNHEIISVGSEAKRGTPVDEAVLERAQNNVNALMTEFVSLVADGRGVSTETVLADYGKGDEMIATAALDVGMIDELGTLEEVLSRLGDDGGSVQTTTAAPSGQLGEIAMARPTAVVGTPRAEAEPEKKDSKKAEGGDDGAKAEGEPEMVKCMKCGGSGKNADGAECKHCEGEGEIEKEAEAKADADGDDDGDKAEGHDEPDGDEEKHESKKALSALSGLRASASVAAHQAAIEAKMSGPKTLLATMEKRLASVEADRAAERKIAEDKRCEAFADRAEELGAFAGLDAKATAEKRAKFVKIARTNEADVQEEILASLPGAKVLGRITTGGHPKDGKHSAQPKISAFGNDGAGRRVTRGDRDVIEIGSPDLMARAREHADKNKTSIEEAMVAVVKADPDLIH